MRPGKAIILVIAVLGLTPWLSMTRYGRAVWSKDDIADAEYNGWASRKAGS